MCCIQIYVLSDVGSYCSIVEEYILSSGFFFMIQFIYGENKNQQVESCLGFLICKVILNLSFNCFFFYLVMLYIIYIRMYDKLVSGQFLDLQSRFLGVFFEVLFISNKILGNNFYFGFRVGFCFRGQGGGRVVFVKIFCFCWRGCCI